MIRVEEYSVELFGDDSMARWKARNALIAMTAGENPAYIRRRSVKSLGHYVLMDREPDVIECLERAATEDASASVRRLAQEALDKLGHQPPTSSPTSNYG